PGSGFCKRAGLAGAAGGLSAEKRCEQSARKRAGVPRPTAGDLTSAAFSPRHERKPLEQMHVLLVLDQSSMQRRNKFFGVALAYRLRTDVFAHQQLEPVEKLGRRRLLLHAGDVADSVE